MLKDSEAVPTAPSAPNGVHLWLVLMKAFHAVNTFSLRERQPNGLGDSDFRVLEALLHKGPLPVNVLGPKVFLTPGSISVAVDRLHAKGLVSRTGSPHDRRVRVVALTARGRRLIERAFHAHARQLDDLASSVLTPAERSKLAALLKKFGKEAARQTAERA